MASLEALHKDITRAKDVALKLYEEHGFTMSEDVAVPAEMAAEARDLFTQIAADFDALEKALTKTGR